MQAKWKLGKLVLQLDIDWAWLSQRSDKNSRIQQSKNGRFTAKKNKNINKKEYKIC